MFTIDGHVATDINVKSDTLLTCVSPEGSGRNVTVKASVGGRSGKTFKRFEYDPPLVLSSSPRHGTADTRIVIKGLNFGNNKIQAFVGDMPCKATRKMRTIDEVICIAPAGVGRNLSVSVRVSDAEGRYQRTRLTSNATFSYPPAAVKSISHLPYQRKATGL